MKRLHLIILLGLLCLASGLRAQEDKGEQLLVFRSTGVVDLLYSNKVDSILTNDSAQIFYAKDTVLVVPLAELDSVAVGSRNEMQFHADVKELTATDDLPWIIRFDGEAVYYRNDTPASILPKVGMKLFYGIEDNPSETSLFPFGLCVRVTSLERLGSETRVGVEQVGLEDIFSRLFFAGPIQHEIPVQSTRRRAPVNANLDLETGLDIDDVGSVDAKGSLKISGDAVFRIGYQHADLTLSYGYGMDVKLTAAESATYNYEKLGPTVNIGTFYKLLNLRAAAGAFADLEAELSLGLDLERSYQRRLLWTRRGDDSFFEYRDASKDEPYEDKAKFDLTLSGSVFFGPMVRIDFATIGDLVGARAKLKLGTEITGEISLGMLQDMRNYDSQAYANANLGFCGKAAVEGYITHRHSYVWGEIDENKVFDVGFSFGGYTWNLFPDYQQTSASASTTPTVTADVAAAVTEPTPTDIETGFEIVDPQGEVVDSIFVGTILAEPEDTTVAQTFQSEIALPSTIKREDMEGYTMRPVFHYAGYTISAAPVGIKKDVLMQPYSAAQSNGAMTFVSAGPFLGEATKDGTNYRLGAYLPTPLKQNVYRQGSGFSIVVSQPIDDSQAALLAGTWTNDGDDQPVNLNLADNGTGQWDGRPFTYALNQPQSGSLTLTFSDADTPLRVWQLISVSATTLVVKDKQTLRQLAFHRG